MGIIPKFIDEAASKPAQAVGQTLSDLWQLSIGNQVTLWAKKQQHRHSLNFEDYVSKIQNKTQEIPEEFLQEPKLNIVGPALEASKYYIDSEILREMFANLISSSVDSRKSSKTHPSFVEIIKQLSSLDAKILTLFKEMEYQPVIRLEAKKMDNGFTLIEQHILDLHDKDNYKAQVLSISNLQRLGLLYVDYSDYIDIEGIYDYIDSHPAFEKAKQQVSKFNNHAHNVVIINKKGFCSKTPLCKDFLEICL